MTKKEALRQTAQENTLLSLGFVRDEAEALRRISMTLHRWYELECGNGNGGVERDEDTGKTYWHDSHTGRRCPIPDRETGARKRLEKIIGARNARVKPEPGQARIDPIGYYLQTDPRGAALYILRPGDVPEGAAVESYYNRGVSVW